MAQRAIPIRDAWGEEAKAQAEALRALPADASYAEVMAVDVRVSDKCGECREPNERLVRIGEEPDYDACTAWVCEKCLRKALALLVAEKR